MLKKIQERIESREEKNFIHNFLVVGYFRIPHLRQRIIEGLKLEQRTIPHEEDLFEKESTLVVSNDYFLFSFEWEFEFYEYIHSEARGKA